MLPPSGRDGLLKGLAAKTDNLSWTPQDFNGVRRDPQLS